MGGGSRFGFLKLGWAGWLALAAMGLLFVGKLLVWLLPHNDYGLFSEAALVLLALALAWAAARLSGRWNRMWPVLAFALYLGMSSAWLGWSPQHGLGFGVNKRYIFSAPGCEFAVDFAQPPAQNKLRRADDGYLPDTYAAASVDVAAVVVYRAECTALDPAALARGPEEVRKLARAATRLWAETTGLRIGHEEFLPVGDHALYRLDGFLAGSVLPEGADGKSRTTLAAVWTYIGAHSVMNVYVLQSEGAQLSARSSAFLGGVYRR